MDFENLISYIVSSELQQTIEPLKMAFIAVFLFFFLALVIFIFRTDWLRFRFLEDIFQFFTYRPYGIKRLVKPWSKILKKIKTGKEFEYKLAVIEADSMVDEMLKKSGYSGKDLKEKLQQAGLMAFINKEELLDAHKIRLELVSNPDYQLDLGQAKKILDVYEKTLINLGLL